MNDSSEKKTKYFSLKKAQRLYEYRSNKHCAIVLHKNSPPHVDTPNLRIISLASYSLDVHVARTLHSPALSSIAAPIYDRLDMLTYLKNVRILYLIVIGSNNHFRPLIIICFTFNKNIIY